jgi:hypothetical protein
MSAGKGSPLRDVIVVENPNSYPRRGGGRHVVDRSGWSIGY